MQSKICHIEVNINVYVSFDKIRQSKMNERLEIYHRKKNE